jgi:hypothetical protein
MLARVGRYRSLQPARQAKLQSATTIHTAFLVTTPERARITAAWRGNEQKSTGTNERHFFFPALHAGAHVCGFASSCE